LLIAQRLIFLKASYLHCFLVFINPYTDIMEWGQTRAFHYFKAFLSPFQYYSKSRIVPAESGLWNWRHRKREA